MNASRRRSSSRGVALLGVLALLATLAGLQFLLMEHHGLQRQRDREAQLIFVGEQYRRALASYARRTPVGAPPHPLRLEELLEDRRFPQPIRHLRQLWPDPYTGQADWVLIKAGDRIIGLHSRSTAKPLRQRGPGTGLGAEVQTVGEWRFVHRVTMP